jgi:hypothetical protein
MLVSGKRLLVSRHQVEKKKNSINLVKNLIDAHKS